MAVNINVPSQVRTFANLAAFPATGALKTIYIAEDTNKTYRWTGSVYTEISASAAMTWGAIGGTLSNQTDLQSALNAKQDSLGFTPVPTTRTLTINGTTQDLSADRTFTISTGITIGTTAIASGTVGRVLFQGTGNVVQQSTNLFWDATNNRLGLGTSSPSQPLHVVGRVQLDESLYLGSGGATNNQIAINATGSNAGIYSPAYSSGPTSIIQFKDWNGTESMRLTSTRNLLINTTTDAGFRLDVNGALRSLGFSLITPTGHHYATAFSTNTTDGTFNFRRFSDNGWVRFALGASSSFQMAGNTGTGEGQLFASGGGFFWTLYTNAVERMRIATTGNVLINTTTDAGFRLDVNGTARVDQTLRINGTGTGTAIQFPGGRIDADTNWIRIKSPTNQDLINVANNFVGINANTVIASAIFAITSTNRGFLPPRMTTTEKNAIASPAAGLMVYDTTLNVISYYNGSMWI